MSQAASRKKLLIAESELNRALLALDWQMMTDDAKQITGKLRTVSSFASAGLGLVGAFRFFRRKPAAQKAGKASWLKTALKTAGTVSAIWSAFRSRRSKDTDK